MNPHTVNTDVEQLRLLLWFVTQILAPSDGPLRSANMSGLQRNNLTSASPSNPD
jgi:hypothetical protein